MAKYWRTVITSVVVVCILFMAGYLIGGKMAGSPVQAKAEGPVPPEMAVAELVGIPWQQWSTRVEANIHQREAIVAGLRQISEDEARDGEERIFGILLMARTGAGSVEAVNFLVENVAVSIKKSIFVADDDEQKQQPCFYALKQMGWQVVPHALDFSNAQRSDKELDLLAKLFVDICGPRAAPAMLQAKIEEFTGDAMKTSAVKNIEQMLSHMRASNDAAQ